MAFRGFASELFIYTQDRLHNPNPNFKKCTLNTHLSWIDIKSMSFGVVCCFDVKFVVFLNSINQIA